MNNYIENLENTQKWLINIMRTYLSDKLYKESEIYDTRQLFAEKTLLAYLKNKVRVFKFDHEHSTQQKHNSVIIPKKEKTIGQRCFSFIFSIIWQYVPDHIKQNKSYGTFKLHLKKWLNTSSKILLHQAIDRKNNKLKRGPKHLLVMLNKTLFYFFFRIL